MMQSFVPFHDLQPGVHALTDASSVSSLRNIADTLSTELDPSLARVLLHEPNGYGLEPALNLLERWIVVDRLIVDLVAVDSLNVSKGAVMTFRHEPSELTLLTTSAAELER